MEQREALEAFVAQSTEASGVPEFVEDEATLLDLARLLQSERRP